MIPSSTMALALIVVAVLPGSMYTWSFERQANSFGVTFADRVLRFVAISVGFHLVLGWFEYPLFRIAFRGHGLWWGQFAAGWAAVLVVVAVPTTVGSVIGGLYATRSDNDSWKGVRKLLGNQEELVLRLALGRDPAPRAWDSMFVGRPVGYIRVQTTDGDAVAGTFARDSYAGGFPNDTDLLLEERWELAEDGTLSTPLGYPVYIPASRIALLELLPTPGDNDERTPREQLDS